MSSLLTEPLNLWLKEIEFAAIDTETPYLFYPTTSNDTTRCLVRAPATVTRALHES